MDLNVHFIITKYTRINAYAVNRLLIQKVNLTEKIIKILNGFDENMDIIC